MAAAAITVTALPTRNSTRQSANWTTAADSGSPIAPPTPRVALTVAIAEESCSRGTTSRSSAIPNGTMPDPSPCSARPTIMISTDGASAQTIPPRISGIATTRIIRFLPNRSPSRPAIGTATAAASSVTVTIHAVFAAELSKISGNRAINGVTIVCVREDAMPANARTATMTFGRVVDADTTTPNDV